MSYFKTKMPQIRFRLGLRPKPRWGSLQCSPEPLAGFKGPTSKGREGSKDGSKGHGRGRAKGRIEGKGKRSYERYPSSKFATTPLTTIQIKLYSALTFNISLTDQL